MTTSPDSGDDLLFADDEAPEAAMPARAGAAWKVLIVDDDEAVHQVTRLALGGLEVDGCPVTLWSARSGEEGRALVEAHPDAALVMVDVVMETPDAGLRLAEWIRRESGNALVRVVLRTGQPGLAPEASVMSRYDIHDYHSKTELTAQRLRTVVVGGVRAHRDLKTIALQRHGLSQVIEATSTLFLPRRLEALLEGILEQISAMLLPREHAVFFLARTPLFAPTQAEPVVVAASGRYAGRVGQAVEGVLRSEVLEQTTAAEVDGVWRYVGDDGIFVLDLGDGIRPCLFLEGARSISAWERQTLGLFCSSAAMALRNQRLFVEREELLSAFERFVPKPLIGLMGHGDVRRVGVGEQVERELTVVFVDVRGFTRRSEQVGASGAFALLNKLFGALGTVAIARGGVIDKYQGDGVMILFPEGPQQALDAAVEMRRTLDRLNAAGDLPGGPVALGMTLQHGKVMMGTVGHASRFDLTIVSDVANVAARLQALCRRFDASILAGAEACPAGVEGAPLSRRLGAFELRGREQAVCVVEVFEADPEPVRAAKLATRELFERGVWLRDAGKWLEAAGAFQRVLEATPADPAAAWMAVDCLANHQRRQHGG